MGFLAPWARFLYRDPSSTPKHTTESTTELPGAKLALLLSHILPSSSNFPGKYTDSFTHALEKDLQVLFYKEKSVKWLSKTDDHFFDPWKQEERSQDSESLPNALTLSNPAQSWSKSELALFRLLSLHCFWFYTLWVISADSMRPAGWPASSSGSPALMHVSPSKHLLWEPVSPPWWVTQLPLPVFSPWPIGMLLAKLSFSQNASDCVTVYIYFWQHSQLCVISKQMNNFHLCISMSLRNVQGSEVQLEIFPERWVK